MTNKLILLFLLLCVNTAFAQKATKVTIIAHRGGTTERPENTLSAYKRAVEQGAEMLEIDVRTSSDGKLFILHDATLDRTTNGNGPATALTMQALSQLDAGSWFDGKYANERIPAFTEVLAWAKKANAMLLLDLKETGQTYVERVVADINQYGNPANIVVGVRTVAEAEAFRKLLPNSKQLGFIPKTGNIEAFAAAGVDVIRLWMRWLDKDPLLVEKVRVTGKKLMVNGTYGKPDETKKLMAFSPDWILVNDPAQLRNSLEKILK